MDKMKMHTPDLVNQHIEQIAQLFPNAVTETIKDGKTVLAVDFDILRQELSDVEVEGNQERYQFIWPDKRKSVLLANAPIAKTLRPCREKSVDFDTTENVYIEGDNLDALKLLQETYLGKVKMIYIDPPYNTGNDFVYEDDYAQNTDEYLANSGQFDEDGNRLVQNTDSNGRFHTDWLNMIYPRLKLAKDLLSDDGVVFISIDENEVYNLIKVCNEILGDSNYVATLILKNNSAKNQSKFISVTTEYCVLFAKNYLYLKNHTNVWRIKKKGASEINKYFLKRKNQNIPLEQISEEIRELYSRPKFSHLSRWNKVDRYGVFADDNLSRTNGAKNFTIINPNTGKPCAIPDRGWGKSQDELKHLQEENKIWYGESDTPPRLKTYLTEDSVSVPDNYGSV